MAVACGAEAPDQDAAGPVATADSAESGALDDPAKCIPNPDTASMTVPAHTVGELSFKNAKHKLWVDAADYARTFEVKVVDAGQGDPIVQIVASPDNGPENEVWGVLVLDLKKCRVPDDAAHVRVDGGPVAIRPSWDRNEQFAFAFLTALPDTARRSPVTSTYVLSEPIQEP